MSSSSSSPSSMNGGGSGKRGGSNSAVVVALGSSILYIMSGICQPLLMTMCSQAGLADPKAQVYMFFYYLGPASLTLMMILKRETRNDDPSVVSSSRNNVRRRDGKFESQFESLSTTVQNKNYSCSRATSIESTDNFCTASVNQNNMIHHRSSPSSFACPLLHNYDSSAAAAIAIALLDIVAQTLNYTGAALAGPTVFAIIYSSVTIWTALYSRILLARNIHPAQWAAIGVVFFGLCLSATSTTTTSSSSSSSTNSSSSNRVVVYGVMCTLLGSSLHGASYVLNEALLKGKNLCSCLTHMAHPHHHRDHHRDHHPHHLPSPFPVVWTPVQNAAVQGSVACLALGLWQILYTLPHYQSVLAVPMQKAGTSIPHGLALLTAFGLTNLIHSVSFSYTLQHVPGGATTAGLMKAFQAVWVMVAAHVLFCNNHTNHHNNNDEMCFSWHKTLALLTVCGGVAWFGTITHSPTTTTTTTTTTTIPILSTLFTRGTTTTNDMRDEETHALRVPLKSTKHGYARIIDETGTSAAAAAAP